MYQKEPVADRPDTENGLMYVRSLTYIKRHLKDLGQKLGRTIDPAYIQGYLLTYTMTVDYAETFEDQTSMSIVEIIDNDRVFVLIVVPPLVTVLDIQIGRASCRERV